MACGACSHRRVEPSISVNKNVMVPVGIGGITVPSIEPFFTRIVRGDGSRFRTLRAFALKESYQSPNSHRGAIRVNRITIV
jgi:hypothetical protein